MTTEAAPETTTTTALPTTTEAPTTTTTEPAGPYDAFLRSIDGQVFMEGVRESETVVVGRVFSEEMTDTELVDFAIAVCFLDEDLGLFDALEAIESTLGDLGWTSPADESMANLILASGSFTVCGIAGGGMGDDPLATIADVVPAYADGSTPTEDEAALIEAFLGTLDGEIFIEVVRDEEAGVLGSVFSTEMSDAELVAMAQGICHFEAEVGFIDALSLVEDELAAAGWGSPADQSLLSTIFGAASVTVCATVGG
ncbi:MAG: hypothetical protein JRI25_09560 [Deltaproteobacteria bacterium]|nr:hypothetical protein [Deltaproteobacteria bacterium]